jgi:hypothetical protein
VKVRAAHGAGKQTRPLERTEPQPFYSPVTTRGRAGIITGAVSASATAGVMAGFAVREHVELFSGAGRQLLAITGGASSPSPSTALAAGIGLHLLVGLAWGLAFALVAGRLRGLPLLIVAALASAVIWALDQRLIPPVLRYGNDLTAFAPQAAVFHLALAVALAVGTRLARVSDAG